MKPVVSVVDVKDYNFNDVLSGVTESINLLGGIEKFISPGKKVLIKPNLLSTYKPEQAITTHPEVVRAVIRILKKINCEIFVGDGPSVWAGNISEVDDVYRITGMADLCKQENVNLVKFNDAFFLDDIPITQWVRKCDYIISLPKFKTHDLMVLTGAVKNLFGLIPGMFKAELHRRFPHSDDLAKILIKIATNIKPTLSIIDGVVALEGAGPATAGTPKDLGLILAGSDTLALDIVMARIMGLNPQEVPTIKQADYSDKDIEIIGEDIFKHSKKKFQLPAPSLTNKVPKIFLPLVQRIFYFKVVTNKDRCIFCKRCIKACPVSAITPSEDERKVYINQKKCIQCFCCREVCPVNSIDVKKNLGFRILEKLSSLLR